MTDPQHISDPRLTVEEAKALADPFADPFRLRKQFETGRCKLRAALSAPEHTGVEGDEIGQVWLVRVRGVISPRAMLCFDAEQAKGWEETGAEVTPYVPAVQATGVEEAVEEIAKALYAECPHLGPWEQIGDEWQDTFRDKARDLAAIQPFLTQPDSPSVEAERARADRLEVECRELEDANRSLTKMRDAALEGKLAVAEDAQPEKNSGGVDWNLPERLRTDDQGADFADELRTAATHLREEAQGVDIEKEMSEQARQLYDRAGMLDEAAAVVEWAGDQIEARSLTAPSQPQLSDEGRDALEVAATLVDLADLPPHISEEQKATAYLLVRKLADPDPHFGKPTGTHCESCDREERVGDEGWESREGLSWCPDCFEEAKGQEG